MSNMQLHPITINASASIGPELKKDDVFVAHVNLPAMDVGDEGLLMDGKTRVKVIGINQSPGIYNYTFQIISDHFVMDAKRLIRPGAKITYGLGTDTWLRIRVQNSLIRKLTDLGHEPII